MDSDKDVSVILISTANSILTLFTTLEKQGLLTLNGEDENLQSPFFPHMTNALKAREVDSFVLSQWNKLSYDMKDQVNQIIDNAGEMLSRTHHDYDEDEDAKCKTI
jgi:hypothetical protein